MGQPEFKPRLIHNKRGAVIALCLTGFVAALSFRDVLSHPQRKSHWLIDLHFMLPTWALAAVNLGFYAYLLWLGVVFYRIAQGQERVLVIGWFTVVFLGQIQGLVSVSTAATVDYIKAMGMVVAFLAAVDILLKMPASGYPRVDNQTSRST
jgi:hypothetical protein